MLALAWQFLRYDRAKSMGALFGAVVSVFLIGQQLGIGLFLTDSMVAPIKLGKADLWVVDANSQDVNALGAMDIRVLTQVASTDGVATAFPLVLAPAVARFSNGTTAAVTLLGAQAPLFRGFPRVEVGQPADLIRDGSVGFDRFDRPNFGGADLGAALEINGRRATLAIRSGGVRTFSQPVLFAPIERARALAGIPTTSVQAVLVELRQGADPGAVASRIESSVAGVKVWTPDALARSTQSKLLATTGIAASIGTLVVFAVIVGFVIIGLTLYSAVVDRLRDFATMKALGARNRDVTRIVLTQAAMIAGAGSAIGMLLILGFRAGIGQSGVLFTFPVAVWSALAGGTLAVSSAGALFAIRRLKAVEPATVFRS